MENKDKNIIESIMEYISNLVPSDDTFIYDSPPLPKRQTNFSEYDCNNKLQSPLLDTYFYTKIKYDKYNDHVYFNPYFFENFKEVYINELRKIKILIGLNAKQKETNNIYLFNKFNSHANQLDHCIKYMVENDDYTYKDSKYVNPSFGLTFKDLMADNDVKLNRILKYKDNKFTGGKIKKSNTKSRKIKK